MPVLHRVKKDRENRIQMLPVGEIRPNPNQPRRSFDEESLYALARSIRRYGILQPLTVRRRMERYELVSGERRLRAAKMAGLCEVPCIVLPVNMEESGVLALVENLQRENLSFLEEAEGIARLVELYGLSQEEAARRLGRSPSAVANKLRLLRLPSDVLEKLCTSGLTERHGRALLRLGNVQVQRAALDKMVELGMNVAAAESYVEALLRSSAEENPAPTVLPVEQNENKTESSGQRTFVMKDLRLLCNTINRSLAVMRQGGIDAELSNTETDEEVILTIRIGKQSALCRK